MGLFNFLKQKSTSSETSQVELTEEGTVVLPESLLCEEGQNEPEPLVLTLPCKPLGNEDALLPDSVPLEDYDDPDADKSDEELLTPNKKEPLGYFDIKKTSDDRFSFNLFASNNQIVATSQVYSSAESAIKGIQSIVANAENAALEDQTLKNFEEKTCPKWEIFADKAGQYRFRLNASNGNTICHSQGYSTKSACKKGIASIIRHAQSAKIVKSYKKEK